MGFQPAAPIACCAVSLPRVTVVAPGSPAESAGLLPGDEIQALDGVMPRDVIEWRFLVDEPEVRIDVRRGGLERTLLVEKEPGAPLGAEVDAAIFDEVQTCDNHCEFCFIYQLPPGMRRSLYLKDDDHRLSFLYGNFTTLTRFTESDLERVVSEGLSPLYVSIHATDPEVRAAMLRNRRGATSLRWLRALLDHEVTVHGQIVVCPGVNDGAVLESTLAGVLDEYPELATLAVVPLGVSDHSDEARMRPHSAIEAEAVVDRVEGWQELFLSTVGRRLVFPADEYYLLAGRPFPPAETYEGFAMHEDGIGMARTFEAEFTGAVSRPTGPRAGFFAWVDGAPAEGYRAPRRAPAAGAETAVRLGPTRGAPVALLTAPYGARVLEPLLDGVDRGDVRLCVVENRFFGGNIAVTGLMVGEDVARVLAQEPAGHRYLLPDVCLSEGRFLDGMTVEDLPRPVEVVGTDGLALRDAIEHGSLPVSACAGACGS
jgi:putative radical SAM enzyme (TIGR03279 family)